MSGIGENEKERERERERERKREREKRECERGTVRIRHSGEDQQKGEIHGRGREKQGEEGYGEK